MGAARRGRPPAPDSEQAVVSLRLRRPDLETIDWLVLRRLPAEFRAVEKAVRKRAERDGKVYVVERQMDKAVERRRLVGEVLQRERQVEEALTVTIRAPCASDDPAWQPEVDEWISTMQARLTEEAPIGIQVALARRTLSEGGTRDREAIERASRAALAAAKSKPQGETS